MQSAAKVKAKILLTSLIITFIITRAYLFFSPNTDLDILGYNIHHLYTGVLLVMFSSIPLVLFELSKRISYFATFVFGVGMSLVLDEWVYLITTDGSNSSYLLPVSFWGGVAMVLTACAYTAFLYIIISKR